MTPSLKPAASAPSRRLLWWGAAGAAILMVAGGAAFTFASMRAPAKAAGDVVTVTLRDGACDPNALTVPAGRTDFRIVNATSRAVEWEILDGVMVLEERENIAPGISQTLGARLRAGQYAITCGLLSNPRGTLTVTPSAASGDAERPQLVAFIAPLAEYQVFLAMQGNAVVKGAEALDAAIAAGDLNKAKSLYGEARLPYLKVESVVSRFADLDNAIDPVAAYLEKREDDHAFTGYHRLEYGLFGQNSLDGLRPVSQKLVADASALKARLRAARLTPEDMGSGAVRVLQALADTRVPGGESAYARADLAEFEAQLAGVRKITTLLKPVATLSAPGEVGDVEAKFAGADAALASLKGPEGYPPYDTVGAQERTKLANDIQALAKAVERMNGAVGLAQGGA